MRIEGGGKYMTVLVAGGCGYIGSHVTRLLLEAGHDVALVDDLSSGDVNRHPRYRSCR